MKYRHFPAAVLAAGLLFCTLFSGLTAYADDKKSELTQKQTDTRQEYEAAQSALEELQNEQTQTESEVAALTGQAAELAGQITAVTAAVQNAQTVLDERQAAADAARAALDAKQAEYDARLAVCREQLRAMQRLDGGGAVWLLAQAKSLYQLLTFDAVLQQMSARNSTVLAELDAEAAALEQARAAADEAALQAADAKAALEQQQAALADTQTALEAALLDANLRAKTFWRMGVLLPYVVAPVAVSLIFSKLFADQSGLVNTLLATIGIDPIGFHSDRLASHLAIATMVNFRWTGYNTLIFLAAMQAVPRDLYEAAIVDGASRWRQFWSVTVPMLRATIIFVVITSTIGGLQIFDEPRMYDTLGLGGADRQWMTMTMYLYELGWGAQKSFGRAAAVAWILFGIIIAIGLVNFLLTQRIASGDAPRRIRKGART